MCVLYIVFICIVYEPTLPQPKPEGLESEGDTQASRAYLQTLAWVAPPRFVCLFGYVYVVLCFGYCILYLADCILYIVSCIWYLVYSTLYIEQIADLVTGNNCKESEGSKDSKDDTSGKDGKDGEDWKGSKDSTSGSNE